MAATLHHMDDCLDVVNQWMTSNYMCMNNNKTEFLPVILKIATATVLVVSTVIHIGDVTITASRCVCNLDVVIDHHLVLRNKFRASSVCVH